MMPTHGLGIFRNMLLGSVTSKVLHDARCPVWTATHAEEQRSPAEPRNILCAVDGASPEAAYLIGWAVGFSGKMGASLKLLHAVPPISDWLAIPSERELQEEVQREAEKKLEEVRAEAGVNVPLRVSIGKVTDAVVEAAREEKADLLIIGRGSAQSALGRLRTHVHGIIQQSPCPVLSV
jgi:nucleotide-binding universal stress UspA family protein